MVKETYLLRRYIKRYKSGLFGHPNEIRALCFWRCLLVCQLVTLFWGEGKIVQQKLIDNNWLIIFYKSKGLSAFFGGTISKFKLLFWKKRSYVHGEGERLTPGRPDLLPQRQKTKIVIIILMWVLIFEIIMGH